MFGYLRKDKKASQVEITIASFTVIRVLLFIFLSVIMLAALHRASHALTLIFVAFFLALALNSPVHWIAERLPGSSRGNRTLATATAFISIVLLLAGFIASIAPPLVRQTSNFVHQAPHIVEDLHNQNTSVGSFVRNHHLENQVDKFAKQLSARLNNISGSAFTTVTRISSSVFSVLTVLVLTFMMLIEGPQWLRIAERLLPESKETHAKKIVGDMYKVIKGYVNGQLFLAVLAGVLIIIPLLILHVSYPVALMVIVFVCGLIPLVGHTIGAVIVSTIALFHSVPAAIIVFCYYILYQQFETYFIQPRIQANATEMSPLLVFSSVIIGVSFSGLLGGLVAIPIAGCLRILVLDYLNRNNLIEPETAKAGTK
ncbi:MAG TPA: AI-2E family transporter [Patescibacteria group bacterium]|nr:AI-2E family transporter [Patescibacteria group bacterium]